MLYIVEEPQNLNAISVDPESLRNLGNSASVLRLAESIEEVMFFIADRDGLLLGYPDLS